MKKGRIFSLVLITLVSCMFYGSVWAYETTTLSDKLLLSGFVGLGHFFLGGIVWSFSE